MPSLCSVSPKRILRGATSIPSCSLISGEMSQVLSEVIKTFLAIFKIPFLLDKSLIKQKLKAAVCTAAFIISYLFPACNNNLNCICRTAFSAFAAAGTFVKVNLCTVSCDCNSAFRTRLYALHTAYAAC